MADMTVWSPPSWSSLMHRPNPFAELDNFLREMFGATGTTETFGGFSPAAEVIREGDDAVVRLELPGVDVEKDVNVDLEGNQLIIHGERRDEHSENKDGRSVHEVRYGSFRRSFTVPGHVNSDAISASYDAGVLTVKIAGAYAGSKSQRIAISK